MAISTTLRVEMSAGQRQIGCGDPGSTIEWQASIQSANQSADRVLPNPRFRLGSGPVDQSLPDGFLGRVLVLRSHGSTPITVTTTQASSGETVHEGVAGLFVREFASGDEMVDLALEGDGVEVEWTAWGGVE